MLTIQSLILILKLKYSKEPCISFYDLNTNLYYIYKSSETEFNTRNIGLSSKENAKYIAVVPEHILDYLKRKGYIKSYSHEIEITHEGFNIFQINFINFMKFLGKSVVVPIIIALITSWLYNHYA